MEVGLGCRAWARGGAGGGGLRWLIMGSHVDVEGPGGCAGVLMLDEALYPVV